MLSHLLNSRWTPLVILKYTQFYLIKPRGTPLCDWTKGSRNTNFDTFVGSKIDYGSDVIKTKEISNILGLLGLWLKISAAFYICTSLELRFYTTCSEAKYTIDFFVVGIGGGGGWGRGREKQKQKKKKAKEDCWCWLIIIHLPLASQESHLTAFSIPAFCQNRVNLSKLNLSSRTNKMSCSVRRDR